jgi:NAD(P)-dependent dehydrogenase (short-subunit alcohol dehydrogenase family)
MELHSQKIVILGGNVGNRAGDSSARRRRGREGRCRLEQCRALGRGVRVSTCERRGLHTRCSPRGRDPRVLRADRPFRPPRLHRSESLPVGPIAATNLETARRALEIRFWGAYAAVKHGAPCLRPGGSIVLSSGIASARPQATWTVASGICGAVEALARALAVELAPIRVNAVAPSVVRSNLWRDMSEDDRSAMYSSLAQALPAGRAGEVDDVAETFLYLMRSGYSTGTIVTIDGGSVLV